MLRGTVAAALVCVLAGVTYADNKEAAKQSYTEGKRQYDLGDYDAALAAFKKAYLNYEEPVFLFNIAQCYRAMGDRPGAVRSYRAFLRNWPKAPNREQVERIVAELEAAIAQDEQAKAAPPQGTLSPKPAAVAKAPATTPPAPTPPATTQPPAATSTPPAQREKPAVASAPPPPSPPSSAPPPATVPEPKPAPAAKHPPPQDELAGMIEVQPNFERPSGSAKPLKWWAWTLIAVAAGGVAAAAIVLGVTQSGSMSNFQTTLPDYTARGLTVRF